MANMASEPLPTKAGKAELKWVVGERDERWPLWPVRTGNIITMPTSTLLAMHPLKNGEQYLVHFKAPVRTILIGTDEEVFLTGVTQKAYEAFLKGGETAFFETLKPSIIRQLESHAFGPVKRQGDIWVCRVSKDWDGALSSPLFSNAARPLKQPKLGRLWGLQGTRHMLSGDITNINLFSLVTDGTGPKKRKRKPSAGYHSYSLLKGTINAPDHAPLHVTDGVYLMARTENTSSIIGPRNGGD